MTDLAYYYIFLQMDFSNFPNPGCYDRYLQFHGVETNPKIQIAKNLSCIQYRNLSLLTRKRFFFYHEGTLPAKFLDRYISSM